jgi:hypothetical protein
LKTPEKFFPAVAEKIRLPASQQFLPFFGQSGNFGAFFGAAALKFFAAVRALNEKQMAGFVFAVLMSVARFAALMAMADNFIGDLLAHPAIENKIFAFELIL